MIKLTRILFAIVLILIFLPVPGCIPGTSITSTSEPEDTSVPGTETVSVPSETPTGTVEATPTPQATEAQETEQPSPTLSPVPSAVPTQEASPVSDIPRETNANLIPPITGDQKIVYEMKDPRITPQRVGWPHPTNNEKTQVWYAADDYHCDGDFPEILDCKAPFSSGDTKVRNHRPEYVTDRCPPHDPDGGNCQPNLQFFCFDGPCLGGWQWKNEFSDLDIKPFSGVRTCELTWQAYIWSPDPDYSKATGDWYISGARIKGASEDNKRSVNMRAVVSDNWILRPSTWGRERRFGYPNNDVSFLPFDEWKEYNFQFALTSEMFDSGTLVAGIGFEGIWGWQNNFYIKDVSLICDGVSMKDDSNQSESTPTPISTQETQPPVEATPLGGEHFPQFVKLEPPAVYVVRVNKLYERAEHSDGPGVKVMSPRYLGDMVSLQCLYIANAQGDTWGSESDCSAPSKTWTAVTLMKDGKQIEYMGLSSPVGFISNFAASIVPLGTGGGGNKDMSPDVMSHLLHVAGLIIVTLLTFVPLVGGSAGSIVGLVVDVIKAFLLLRKDANGNPVGLPDDWGGLMAIIINAVVWIGLFFLLGRVPTEILPPDVDQWIKIGAMALTFMLTFLVQLRSSGMSHAVLVKRAPLVFSTTQRKLRLSGGGAAKAYASIG
jgi:hypothetical protein